LRWARGMLDACVAAFGRRGVQVPPPMVVADSWFSDSKLMQYVGVQHQGTLLVEGKQSYTFRLANGHTVKGCDLIHGEGWQWRQSPWEPGVSYVRLGSIRGFLRPTDGFSIMSGGTPLHPATRGVTRGLC